MVQFKLTHEDLKFFNGYEFLAEAGEFEIAIFNSSDFSFKNSFELKF